MSGIETPRIGVHLIRQQGDAAVSASAGKVDHVFKQGGPISSVAAGGADHQIFKQEHVAPTGRADEQLHVDHSENRRTFPQDKNASALMVGDELPERVRLFFFVGEKLLFLRKEDSGQLAELGNVRVLGFINYDHNDLVELG